MFFCCVLFGSVLIDLLLRCPDLFFDIVFIAVAVVCLVWHHGIGCKIRRFWFYIRRRSFSHETCLQPFSTHRERTASSIAIVSIRQK